MPSLATAIARNTPQTGALHDLLAPAGFAGDAVLTKRGDVFRVLRLHPPDAECLDQSAVSGVCRQFESSLRTFGPEHRVYQYVFRESSPDLAFGPAGSSRLRQSRQRWLEGRLPLMYSLESYLVILRQRPLAQDARSLRRWFSVRRSLEISSQSLAAETASLELLVSGLAVQLRDNLAPEICDRAQTMLFLRRLVNTGSSTGPVAPSVHDFHVDQQIAGETLECWPRHLKQGDNHIRLYSLTEAPASTFPHLLRSLMAVPCNMTVCTEWKREPNGIARAEINKRRRHYHLTKTSALRGPSGIGDSKPMAHEVLVDDSKTALVEQLNAALTEMEVKENFFGKFSLTVELWHPDQSVLERASPRLTEVFSTHDARLQMETHNMLNAWAQRVPGNYEYSYRQMWMLNTCWADMSFLFAPGEGNRHNPHLNKPHLAVMETREQTPYYLNLHVEDVGHTCILGSIGSGKTFLLNFLISQYQQYSPHTFIFDLLGNYRRLTREYGGAYLYASRSGEFTINPFCLPPTKENIDFLFSFVRVLIEGPGTAPLTDPETKDLYRAIGDVYALDPSVRKLSSLIVSRSYSARLEKWVGEGRLASHFDHAEDTLTFSKFQTFDFEGMDKAEVLEPLLFYILHRASTVCREDKSIPKLIVFDEAWRFFKNPVTRAYIHEELKTGRNFNLALLIATQSADDMLRSELKETVAETCMTRIFLANPGMDRAAYMDTFGLNATVAEHISRLIPKREFLLSQPGVAKVLSLNVDPESYKVFTGREQV